MTNRDHCIPKDSVISPGKLDYGREGWLHVLGTVESVSGLGPCILNEQAHDAAKI